MVKIKYIGDISPIRIRVGDAYFKDWKRDEVKELDLNASKKILKNANFIKAGKVKEVKPVVVEKKEEATVEKKKEIVKNEYIGGNYDG